MNEAKIQQLIKMLANLFGIKDLRIKFVTADERIIVHYRFAGEIKQGEATFAEIEKNTNGISGIA
jgi:hypothetical protein